MYEQLKLENQVCFRVYTASRLITQAYRPLLEPLGLTYPKYLVLMVLWEHDNLTVNEIGKQLVLESNTLTPLLKRMEEDGLVVRTRGIVDNRQTLISLTKKGRHMEAQAQNIPALINRCWQSGETDKDSSDAFVGSLDTMISTLQKQ